MILIRPGNPYDFTNSELESLAEELRAADPTLDITVEARSERGYGVSPWEVVELIATAGGATEAVRQSARAVSATVSWARRRWNKDRDDHPGEPPRPRSVRLRFGPDRSIARDISIDLPHGEPEEKTPETFQDESPGHTEESSLEKPQDESPEDVEEGPQNS